VGGDCTRLFCQGQIRTFRSSFVLVPLIYLRSILSKACFCHAFKALMSRSRCGKRTAPPGRLRDVHCGLLSQVLADMAQANPNRNESFRRRKSYWTTLQRQRNGTKCWRCSSSISTILNRSMTQGAIRLAIYVLTRSWRGSGRCWVDEGISTDGQWRRIRCVVAGFLHR
jgi:hypothetical protein